MVRWIAAIVSIVCDALWLGCLSLLAQQGFFNP